ncbi:acyl-CoA thioesterase [Campylobacter pinnipediorum subsp. caledonicus]|uniref:Acyl-CoA thioesterase n=1 Tax=Campylobacter pinnipediorum subsp. caledonicus TaxID=1874362 RepID=A0A1S6U850_9BACT|nr:PaaI family thioesterase [Campylobacter pinnipediorum]AQW87627.1 acyl-CoA thioesterase [Campylobacter pinnipediorum subsp. caledonicus]OPA72240.1 thioesterase [Campylobacter pinnipediorum subsp. caledonicus]
MSDENIFENNSDGIILPEEENPFRNELKTSSAIKLNLSGVVTELKKSYAKTKLFTIEEMVSDNEGLIHSGFVFSAANYAALTSINEEYCVSISARINFFGPVRLGDIVEFEAQAYFDESRKRDVRVTGKVREIKVFEGTFQAVVLEEHVFLAQQKNIQKEGAIRRAKEKEQEKEQEKEKN